MIKVLESEQYKTITFVSNKCLAFKSLLAHDDITEQISYVALLGSTTQGFNTLVSSDMTVAGAVIGGFIGALAAGISSSRKIEVECILYLENGTQHHIITNERAFIKYLLPFMYVIKKRGR